MNNHEVDLSSIKLKIEPVLSELGISAEACNLYFLIYQSENYNFSSLALALNVSRPHLYKLISELELHGLIFWDKKNFGPQRLQICSPTDILQKLKSKKEQLNNVEKEFTNILPALMEKYVQGSQSTKVKIMSTEKDFLELFFQILDEEDKNIRYFGSAKDLISFISWETEKKWIQKRLKNGIRIKVLVLGSEDTRILQKNDENELRETRVFIDENIFPSSFHLFANKIVFWQPEAKNAILLEDKNIVRMIGAMFDFCWKNSAN